ncbi:hypothetical protein JCM11957_13330 [Caminibacter profundus]
MKRFFIFGLIFITIVTLFVYIQDNSFTNFNIFGVNISLPNAIWTALFLGLFFIFTLIYILYLNLKNSISQKNIKKDIEIIINNIKNKILYKNEIKETKVLKNINEFIKNIEGLNIIPKKIERFEFLEDIEKLKNGEVIETNKYKLKVNNPWFILNVKNKLKKEPEFAKEVLKKFKNEELKKEAFEIYAKKASIKDILKYDYPITLNILLSHIKDNDLGLLIQKATLTPKEQIEFAKNIYQTRSPDIELELASSLPFAKAYLALKYEHLDLAREVIEKHNIKYFEFFLNLRNNGIKADIDEYINAKI